MRSTHLLMVSAFLTTFAMTAAQAEEGRKMEHASGTFEVQVALEAQSAAPEGGLPTARMAIRKTFSGPLQGSAVGTMISGGTPSPGHAAAYVAIDQFRGELAGRKGGFMLVHRGTMSKSGASNLIVIIAPDSGSGELTGITGQLEIENEGKIHRYELTYALPER